MSCEFAVSVKDVSKFYNIYPTPRDRLKQFFVPRVQRAIGTPPSQYFREFRALQDISFDIRPGETFGIVGKNGSGKSTLLQIICGTLTPTSGTVQTNGRIAALLELGAGFNPEFSGRDNVYMNARLLGLNDEQIDARFEKITEFADIGQFIDEPVKTYSSGMYVRLAFGVIANVDADILVIDEALAVGDAFFVQKCMRFLRGFMERGTLLFVSHDTTSVQSLCTQALLLKDGQIEMLSSPKEVSKKYLTYLYQDHQDVDGDTGEYETNAPDEPNSGNSDAPKVEPRDMRQDLVNATQYRNDIELFQFDRDADSFGTGLATISNVQILDTQNRPLNWIVGGEQVSLQINASARSAMVKPIIGFEIKNRLGQTIFGDNTFLTTIEGDDISVTAGQSVTAQFEFRLPVMPAGDYSIAVAVADGDQDRHVQHQWMHDALIMRIHASSVCFGVVTVPMTAVKLWVN